MRVQAQTVFVAKLVLTGGDVRCGVADDGHDARAVTIGYLLGDHTANERMPA
jgi:hypothetical protein